MCFKEDIELSATCLVIPENAYQFDALLRVSSENNSRYNQLWVARIFVMNY